MELIATNPLAYTLAAVIALRARWREGFSRHGLGLGEAMLGDFERYGMTQKQYRTAKRHLEKGGFAAFRRASKGTIAKLIDTRLFCVFESQEGEQNGKHGADKGQSKGEQRATNEERIDDKKGITQERLNDAKGRTGHFPASKPLPFHRLSTAFESELMARLRTLLGENEMARVGGNWRSNWVRKYSGIVESGLNELDSEIKAGKDKHNRAAWLVDWCKRIKTANENPGAGPCGKN